LARLDETDHLADIVEISMCATLDALGRQAEVGCSSDLPTQSGDTGSSTRSVPPLPLRCPSPSPTDDGRQEAVTYLREAQRRLRDCRRRGMRDPERVVGDGAMGLWKALTEVFPTARHQRCWAHKARNVANALPKSAVGRDEGDAGDL
jgi:hypothetical protein